MSMINAKPTARLDTAKFVDPDITLTGVPRARVPLDALETLWFNTGTLCNLTCTNCYIESSPTNDSLVYLSLADVTGFLDEIEHRNFPVGEIGFTGGEPFMNPEFVAILSETLRRGFKVLVLTNAMRPMMKCASGLTELQQQFGSQLTIRVSLDHYSQPLHELARGPHSWDKVLLGLRWLRDNDFNIHVAGRTCWPETEGQLRTGFGRLFASEKLPIDARDETRLLLFPEMDETADVPEITVDCWDILDVAPSAMMCANSRMVVKRKGADKPVVTPCTLIPYDERLEMGGSLTEASGAVPLNHPHCARFCVLGGGACSK